MRPTIYSARGVLVCVPILIALLFAEPWSADRHLLSSLGLALVVLGFGVRLWAQQHLHYRIAAGMQLTTTGPYQYIRNPLYVGNILIFVGTVEISGRSWLAVATLLWTAAVYSAVVRFEEDRLTRRYGSLYVGFRNSTPRWVPLDLRKRPLGLLNHHLMASFVAEFLWFGLPLLVFTRRVI